MSCLIFLKIECCLDGIDVVALLPAEELDSVLDVRLSSHMPIGRRRLVDRILQAEALHYCSRAQVEDFAYFLCYVGVRGLAFGARDAAVRLRMDVRRAVGVHEDAHRLG